MERSNIPSSYKDLMKYYAQIVKQTYSLPMVLWIPYTTEESWKRKIKVPLFSQFSTPFIIGHINRRLLYLVRYFHAILVISESEEERVWVEKEIAKNESFRKSLPPVTLPKWALFFLIGLITYGLINAIPFTPSEQTALIELVSSLFNLDIKGILNVQVQSIVSALIKASICIFFYSIPFLPIIIGIFNVKRWLFNNPGIVLGLSHCSIGKIKEEWTKRVGIYALERATFRGLNAREPLEIQIDLLAQILIGLPL
jgi:hypothetical protein